MDLFCWFVVAFTSVDSSSPQSDIFLADERSFLGGFLANVELDPFWLGLFLLVELAFLVDVDAAAAAVAVAGFLCFAEFLKLDADNLVLFSESKSPWAQSAFICFTQSML